MKNIVLTSVVLFSFLLIGSCSYRNDFAEKESENNESLRNEKEIPSLAHLLPVDIYRRNTKALTAPLSADRESPKVYFDIDDVQWYNAKTGELKFTSLLSVDELRRRGYISMIGDSSDYKTFVYANLNNSQIINTPVLYQNSSNTFYLVKGYPFWIKLDEEQQKQRDENLDQLLPHWLVFLELLDKANKLIL